MENLKKNFKLILSTVLLFVFGLMSNRTDAQQKGRVMPPTFLVKEAQALPAQAHVKMPVNFSISELMEEDEFNATHGVVRPRIAKVIPADLTVENSGAWSELPDGRRVWRVAIEAANAKALLLSYDEFYLPAGSQLFIYSADKKHVLDCCDNTSNPRGKEYSSPPVAGDKAVIEYVEPLVPTGDKARLRITGIGYGYNNIEVVETPEADVPEAGLNPGGTGNEYTCHVNIACPEGNGWREEAGTSVCFMNTLIDGAWSVCSATLINNTLNDKTPYIITAWHCGADWDYTALISDADFLKWQFYFFYQTSNCAGTATGHYDNMKLRIGAEVIANTGGYSDGLLLKLVQPIPDEWIESGEIYFAGWDRRQIAPTSGVGISHPNGNPKKISTYTSPATLTGNANYGFQDGSGVVMANGMWQAPFVRTASGFGRSEGGASGSGLFNQNKLLVGTLTGATNTKPSCTSNNPFNVRYGALHAHWDRVGNSPERQMKTWLDPCGGGTAEYCPPYPDFIDMAAIPFDFNADKTNLYALESASFTVKDITCGEPSFSIDSLKWEFESGAPAESTDEQPVIAYETPTGSPFDVKLTIYSKDLVNGNDTVFEITKANYITVTVKGTPAMPAANVAAVEFVESATKLVEDNGYQRRLNGGAWSNTAVASSGSSSTYAKVAVGGTFSGIANTSWTRTNYANSANAGYSGYGYGATTANNDSYFYAFSDYDQRLVSVRMYNRTAYNFSSVTSAKLKFKFKNLPYTDYWDGLAIQYSNTSATGTWTTIKTVEQITTTTPTSGTAGWIDVEVDLPNLTNSYYIGFMSMGDDCEGGGGGDGMGIDNIEIVDMDMNEVPHVILWEGDNVDFYDLSTGVPVLYNYEFEGGSPATSTSDAPIINVHYDTEGLYDVSQIVRNTLGADTMLRDDYVTVTKRILKTDTAIVVADCNNEIDAHITLTANKDWIATYPAWITVNPSSGTVAAQGTPEDFDIHITVPAQTKYVGKIDDILFRTDDYMATAKVNVKQASAAPTGTTALRQDADNAVISWDEPNCFIHEKSTSKCVVTDAGNGNFEEFPQEWTVFTEGDGDGWLWNYPDEANSNSGAGSVIAFSYDEITGDSYYADNWLVTPKLKISEDYRTLTYYVRALDTDPDYIDSYEVHLSTASEITSVADFDVELKALAAAEGIGNYKKISIDLSEYAEQEVYIAFRHFCYDKWGLLIDDVSGLEVASCLAENETESMKPASMQTSLKRMLSINKAKISYRKNTRNKTERQANRKERPQFRNDANSSVQALKIDNKANMQENALQSVNTPMAAAVSGIDDLKKCGNYTSAVSFANMGFNIDGFKVAVRFNESDIVDYSCSELKAITIGIYSPLNIELFVQRGDNVIYTQSVTSTQINSGYTPTTITLTSPVSLAGEGDLYIGYITPNYPSTGIFPYGVDDGPYVDGGAEIFFAGQWLSGSDFLNLNENFHITGHTELEGAIGSYNLYRQRKVNNIPAGEPELIAQDLDTAYYADKNIENGGEYCYWVTFKSKGMESCINDTSCVFIPYQQQIEPIADIEKIYGDDDIKLDKVGTDDIIISSSAEDEDYFAGRTIPVKLEVVSGSSITLTGSENDYTAEIVEAGITRLRATQEGIASVDADTLLPADTVEFNIKINKKALKVKANDATRQEGEANPDFTLDYDSFISGENENNLDVIPTASCSAGVLSPIGQYEIVVNVGNDKNYDMIPVSGILYVTRVENRINAFTPHESDDINDLFMSGYRMKVFNRSGVLIYETHNKSEIAQGWNGRFQNNGQLVNPGVYYYILYDDNGTVIRKGSVNVIKK
ncbi:MAG: choice-of-anchor J domain-containing protein [Prevotellaceae bacterium]|jgi:hypothetical protein|nr:choice-of-anchor J domain-containing protein [Prevotellaceae bacterium]